MILPAFLAALLAQSPTITTLVGTGEPGFSGDGGPAARAQLNMPFDVAYDRDGNLYLSDTFNHRIRRVDAKTGIITTVAGNGEKGFSGDGGPATEASMNEPYGIALDDAGNLYFADRLNYRVRRVDAKSGTITTVAGNGTAVYSGDGVPATEAGLVEPNDVALLGRTWVLIADVAGHRVRVITLDTGRIGTLTGTGEAHHKGDDGPLAAASVQGPRAVEVGAHSIYLIERDGNRVLRIDGIDTDHTTIATIAGTGARGYTGDGGPALEATFDGPKELDVDAEGNLYIVDTENHVIRRIDAKTGIISTAAGNGKAGPVGDGGPATEARLDRPHGVASAPDGGFVVGDTGNHRIRHIAPPNP